MLEVVAQAGYRQVERFNIFISAARHDRAQRRRSTFRFDTMARAKKRPAPTGKSRRAQVFWLP